MAKNYLEISDNVIEKSLLVKTKEIAPKFYNAADHILELNNQVIQFYADKFTGGDFD